MNTKYLHFENDNSVMVSINGVNVTRSIGFDNKYINIANHSPSIIISVNPCSTINNQLLSFTERIDFNKTNDNNLIKVIPFRNNHYELKFDKIKAPISSRNEIVADEYFGKLNIVVSNNSIGNILIYENSKLKKQLTTLAVLDANIKQKDDKLIILCSLKNGQYYAGILNIDSLEILFEKEVDSIEENSDEIKTLTKVNDFAKHGIVKSYNLKNGQTDEYNIYLNGEANRTNNNLLIPYAFLEAIKIKNFNLSKSYLSNGFDNISKEHFENYFGDIKNVYLDSYNLDSYVIPYVVETNKGFDYYDFSIDNGKIIDISKL